MVTVQDIVQLVANRGAASLGDLEHGLPGDGVALLRALDACVDHGYLRLAVRRDETLDAPYRVTRRGHQLLAAASRAHAAA